MSAITRALRLGTQPVPLRTRIIRKFLSRVPVGSFETRLTAGGFERPWYAWCLYYAALEAKALGHNAMTAIELGVAGGNGLLCLCNYRDQVQAEVGLEILVHGFDTGAGLPRTSDPRDLLYCWPAGSFEMNHQKLRERLNGKAEIVLGDVSETTKRFSPRIDAPLGAIMFDLDLYTSTRDAFAVLTHAGLLPRVWCYFDDICGYPENAFSDEIGVRGAIKQFNAEKTASDSHLSQAYVFKGHVPEEWHSQIYVYHQMTHPDYNRCLSEHKHSLDLE